MKSNFVKGFLYGIEYDFHYFETGSWSGVSIKDPDGNRKFVSNRLFLENFMILVEQPRDEEWEDISDSFIW